MSRKITCFKPYYRAKETFNNSLEVEKFKPLSLLIEKTILNIRIDIKNFNVEMTCSKEEIRNILIEIASKEYYQLLQDPSYMGKIMPMVREISTVAGKLFAEDDDEDDELADIIYNQIDTIMTDDEQLRELALQNAKNKYVTKAEATAYLDGYIDGKDLGRTLDSHKKQELKNAHVVFLDKCQIAYDFVEKLISVLVDIAKKQKIDGIINIKTRNAQIKKIVPSAEEYVSLYLTSAEASKEYFEDIQKIVFEEPETRELGKAIFDAMSKSMSSISESLLQYEAKTIYDD